MHYFIRTVGLSTLLVGSIFPTCAQQQKINTSLFEGTLAAGYVDKGAYLNCLGPSIKYNTCPTCSVLIGLLPTLKIKKDQVEGDKPKNSTITPTLGVGLTVIYKHLALQIPTFYTPKTATETGKWKIGLGLGHKF
ncbi:hypothetical protein [Sphingobacterium suaedae]|uniref:Outer membrane protein beta-barrel domain-containing protein n=1 Tax=Sphingobacterium suaedae TaxID=1686402 RepID=A0ABW5KHU9_9SPHI